MPRVTKHTRTDDNQKEVVRHLRAAGFSVFIVSSLKGFCDIIVGARGRNYLFEIKDPDKPPSKRKLTEAEENFHLNWRGQISVVHTFEEALEVIQTQKI